MASGKSMPANIVWQDATSYSQGCKKRVPSVWETRIGGFRVILVFGKSMQNYYYRTLPDLIWDHDLKAKTLEAAQAETLQHFRAEMVRHAELIPQ